MSSILVPILIALATILLLCLLLRRSRNKRLPPGPVGLPLLGYLPFLHHNLHRCFSDLARAYGPVVSFYLGTKLCVAITSPSAAMEVFKVNDAVFAGRPAPITATVAVGGVDIIWSNGPHWRMARKVAVRELLNNPVIESFRWLRRREVHRVVGDLTSATGKPVNVHDVAYSVTINVISGMMWGSTLSDGMKDEIQRVMDGIVGLLVVPNISDFLPVLAPLDLQGLQRRMMGWCKRFDVFFEGIAKDKTSHSDIKCFLHLLLDLVEKRDPGMPLEVHHVKAIIMDLISGGSDTTTLTVEWAISELMRTPEALAELQKELDAVVGKDGVLSEWHLPKLRYLNAVVKETLRLHPVLPLLIPHTPSTTCEVDGYVIPKGTRVFINVWAIQRDPSVWEGALEFKPERFLERENKWDYNAKSFDYLPFGGGKRICPGINMGERMVAYLLGTLLHAFEWRLPHGVTGVDVEEEFGLTMKKKEPLVLVPYIRMGQYVDIDKR